jgi:hypothetical protein
LTGRLVADSVSDADEIPPHAGTPVLDAYLANLNLLLDSDKKPREVAVALAQRMGSKHFLSVLGTITEMDRLYREMHSVLNEFTGRRSFLFTVLTIEHLAMVMKLYVISWHTMLDLVARLVGVTFDLGIADRDVTLRLILNNDHVKSSRIPEILQANEKALLIKDLKKRRNDAVHRGKIPDPDVEAMLKERNTIDSRRYSLLLEPKAISDEEHKNLLSDLQERLGALARAKREMWDKVHAQTIAMTSNVARELAVKTAELYTRRAV